MKNRLITITVLLAGSLAIANAAPKEDVLAAAKKLAESENYSWTATVRAEDDAQFIPGPTNGKTQKDGLTHVTWDFNGNLTHGVIHGEKGAGTSFQSGEWESLAEMEANAQGNFGGFAASRIRGIETAAKQIEFLVNGAKALTQEGDVISGELTEDEAKVHLSFFGRRSGDNANAPAITGAKGNVKFWLEDGSVTKYEIHVEGTVEGFNGATDQDRTTTVEIKDVGSTEIDLPEAAKDKLS